MEFEGIDWHRARDSHAILHGTAMPFIILDNRNAKLAGYSHAIHNPAG